MGHLIDMNRMWVLLAGMSLLAIPRVFAAPGYGEPLSDTTGTVYCVGTASDLQDAVDDVNAAGVPATILVSNGVYVLDTWALPITNEDTLIRSLSGDRDAVVLRGPDEGPSATLEHVFWVAADRVTIADLTFGWCRYHGIQVMGHTPYDVSGLRVHNCRLVNCNEQFIKGTSADGDPEGVTDSLVEFCLFEFTNRWAYQAYTGGIDVHKGVNWTVRDNRFHYIRAPDGYAEHAVHFWKRNTLRAQNIVVERNIVLNCDRGIGFGLGGWDDGFEGGDSVIRNNFIYNSGDGPWTDVGIGLESATGVAVDNNTVLVPYWAPIEYRFSASSNLVFRNNFLNGAITARDGAPAAASSNNLGSAQASWFRSATNGDLHILPTVAAVLDTGCAIADFTDDLDGDARPAGAAWDIGADEYEPWTADSNFDGIPDGWYQQYGLNPVSDTVSEEHGDTDGFDNREEWITLTNPTNAGSYFQLVDLSVIPDSMSIRFIAAAGRLYSLQGRAWQKDSDWADIPGLTQSPGTNGSMTLTDTNAPTDQFYRVGVSLPP